MPSGLTAERVRNSHNVEADSVATVERAACGRRQQHRIGISVVREG
jgi:hypothetical protein